MITRRSFHRAALVSSGLGLLTFSARAAEQTKNGDFPVKKTPEEWKKILTPEQYYVLRDHGTERAFTSPLDKTYAAGEYHCAGCNQLLFKSDTKFDSRTGWPSFWKPEDKAVGTKSDRSFFMVRTEVHCSNCGGHLGHVFDDGPPPTGLRYCMNGVAMKFVPAAAKPDEKKS
jgi:peptide-methionine (R)-S-oxide reductase